MTRPAPQFAAAALAAGVFAAAALPTSRIGLAAVLTALAVAASVALARPKWITGETGPLGALALGLAAVAVLRDATWVVVIDLVAAVLLGVLALTGAASWRSVVRAPFCIRPLRGAALVAVSAAGAVPQAGARRMIPVLRGAAAGVLLLALFGSLFAWADPAFARIADQTLPTGWNLDPVLQRLVLLAAVPALAGSLVLAARARQRAPEEGSRRIGSAEWISALVMVNLLFAVFVGVQITVLFGGDAHVVHTAGLTYAEYARQGFLQLLGVGVLALGLVAVVIGTARAEGRGRRFALRGLLALLVVLTVVVLASAVHRLGLYEEAFGFTRLRLVAHAFMLWLAAMFALVLLALALGRTAWLPRAATVGTGVALLVFALANPDAMIAERNLTRAESTGVLDAAYLAGLSADATPALADSRLAAERGVLRKQAARLAEADGWAGWNASREGARDALRAQGALR